MNNNNTFYSYPIYQFGTMIVEDDIKIRRVAESLYKQVANGSIKIGKINRNHIIKATNTILQEEFNLSMDMDNSENLLDYVAATFFQMYKCILVPHYASLLCPDIDTLKQLHPAFQAGGELSDGIDSEMEALLAFENEMVVAIQIFSPTMQLIIDIVTVYLEGKFKKYINGSGATLTSRRRFQLFRRFKPVSPRFKRRGSGSSYATVHSEEGETDNDEHLDEKCSEHGRRRSRSCESICSTYTDVDTSSAGNPSPLPSPTHRNSRSGSKYIVSKQPVLHQNMQVSCVQYHDSKYVMPTYFNLNQSVFPNKSSYVNSLFPQVVSYSNSDCAFGSFESDCGSDQCSTDSMDGMDEFIELFGSDDLANDFMGI